MGMLGKTQGVCIHHYVPDYTVFDLETTGISCSCDQIIEISAVKVRSGAVVDSFSCLVNPGRPISYRASQVNHITDEMVADEPELAQVLPEILRFAGDDTRVGHNIGGFDMKFLYRDCQRFWSLYPGNDYVDTLKLARVLLSGLPNYRLTTLAEHYGLSTHGAHRALKDCQMNQQIFELLGKEESRSPVRDTGVCPKCGMALKKRMGKFGPFLGCTGYPSCRYTRDFR